MRNIVQINAPGDAPRAAFCKPHKVRLHQSQLQSPTIKNARIMSSRKNQSAQVDGQSFVLAKHLIRVIADDVRERTPISLLINSFSHFIFRSL